MSNNKRTSWLFLVLFSSLLLLLVQDLTLTNPAQPTTVFELELPDFQISSTQSEITVPSSNVSQVVVHILKPAADSIDYGAIGVNINGQAAASISEIVTGLRGKIVKVNLKLLPGYEFVTGRNTVEVWAQNRRGRTYYSSFVIKTATENWNEDFKSEVQQSPGATKEIPPKLVLLEPERPIEFPSNSSRVMVKINGIATATNAIVRVSVDGKNIKLEPGLKNTARQLARLTGSGSSVAFETTRTISLNTPQIVVEVEDKSGSRARVTIPVFTKQPGAIIPISRQKYALIIGISRYKNNSRGIPNLAYADVDANSIYEFLQKPEGGGFSPANMLLLSNEQATFARIHEAVTNFVARASVNDLLLIFFAGHGAPDRFALQNLYLIAHDTDVNNMSETALSMPKLRRYLDENIKSKRVVLLMDACHSAGISPEGTRDLGNNLANQYLAKLLYQEEGRAIITSSDVNELSLESQKWGHGVFTYYVLEGLKGNADANGDRLVSVGELFRYVRQKVRLDTSFQQNPRMLMGDNENLALSVASSQK
jgi:hypothetical protein